MQPAPSPEDYRKVFERLRDALENALDAMNELIADGGLPWFPYVNEADKETLSDLFSRVDEAYGETLCH